MRPIHFTLPLLTICAVLCCAACSPSQPSPATEPVSAALPADSSRRDAADVPVAPAAPPAEIPVAKTQPEKNVVSTPVDSPCRPESIAAFDYKRLHHCTDSLAQAGDFAGTIALLRLQVDGRNNPDQLGRRTLQLARYLDAQGQSREAAKVLEDFLVYKPLVAEWMDSAAALEVQFATVRESKKNSYGSLVKQIRNLGAVNADYDQVRLLTDSLRSLLPGDSLVQWSQSQDELALQRSLKTIEKKTAEIRALVQDAAAFADAAKIADAMLVKYPSLADRAGLKELRRWVDDQEKLYARDADAAYWSNHDPRATLKEARALLERKQYADARVLYRKLLASPQRKDAREDLEVLADAYCEDQRKIAADRFAAARRNPKTAAASLDGAVAALDRCLNDYPEASSVDKVRQNRELLVQEKAKLAGGAK